MNTPKTFVYVDGFNLYYGSLKGTSFKWLDLYALARKLLPKANIAHVYYCTAKVLEQGDRGARTRQQLYWDALRGTGVEIVEGHFLQHQVTMKNVNPPPPFSRVWKAEEKGSDVNLATLLVRDAFSKSFEQALVITNDSDLALPVRVVRDEAKLPVGVGFPTSNPGRKESVQLRNSARFVREIRPAALAQSQLPSPTQSGQSRPPKW